MPQVDLETLVCGCGGDGKVSCETLMPPPPPEAAAAAVVEDPDLPAESYSLRIGDEIGWAEVNAVYERDDSTKGSTNPKSQQGQQKAPTATSTSQRFSGKLTTAKAPIIGLPNKIQHNGYLGHSSRRPANGRIFPKKKKAVTELEPGSPKVSCFGKVLSERERSSRGESTAPPAAMAVQRGGGGGGGGCFSGFLSFLLCGGRQRSPALEYAYDEDDESISPPPRSSGVELPRPPPPPPEGAGAGAGTGEPPGLGGMMRFSSGRRAASWGGDGDGEVDGHVAWSGPLDRREETGRQSVGSVEDAKRDRVG